MVRSSPTENCGPDQGQSGYPGEIMKDKHFLTIVKMIETILAMHSKQDTDSQKVCSFADKVVQVNLMPTESEQTPADRSMLSAREKQRLSLEERIRARKSEVQDSQEKQKDLELKSLKYDLEMLQQKMIALNDDKLIAEVKVQEQERNMQEQLDLIQEQSKDLESMQERSDQQSKRIRELEAEIERLNGNDPNGFGLLKNTRFNKSQVQELDKCPALQVIDDEEDCCGPEKPIDVISSDIGANLSHQENLNNTVNHFNAYANSFHVTDEVRASTKIPNLTENLLKEDSEVPQNPQSQIAEENTETPMKSSEPVAAEKEAAVADTTVNSTPLAKAEEKPAAHTELKVGTIQLDDKKNNLMPKKPKGQFEFPDGGWECSKCQNYNFKGRKECNRCKKARTKQDLSGKPLHLLKSEQKDASAGLKL